MGGAHVNGNAMFGIGMSIRVKTGVPWQALLGESDGRYRVMQSGGERTVCCAKTTHLTVSARSSEWQHREASTSSFMFTIRSPRGPALIRNRWMWITSAPMVVSGDGAATGGVTEAAFSVHSLSRNKPGLSPVIAGVLVFGIMRHRGRCKRHLFVRTDRWLVPIPQHVALFAKDQFSAFSHSV